MDFLNKFKRFSEKVKSSSPLKSQGLYGAEDLDYLEDLLEKEELERKEILKLIQDSPEENDLSTLSTKASSTIQNYINTKNPEELESIYYNVIKLIAQEDLKSYENSEESMDDLYALFEKNKVMEESLPELEVSGDEDYDPAKSLLDDLNLRKKQKEDTKVNKSSVFDIGTLIISFDNTSLNSDILSCLRGSGFSESDYLYFKRSYNLYAKDYEQRSRYEIDSKDLKVESKEQLQKLFTDLLTSLIPYLKQEIVFINIEGLNQKELEDLIKEVM